MRIINKFVKETNVYPYKKCYPHIKSALQQEGEIDLLISIAHPHVVHWAVSEYIDRKNVKTWIADCGDPFMGDPFNKHKASLETVEKKWCSKVDYITIPVKDGISAYYPEYQKKIRIIPQGFKIDKVDIKEYKKNDIPTFGFAGIVYPAQRDPRKFLEYIYKENIKYIFTKSQFKMWKYYDSWEQYKEYYKHYNCTAGYTNKEEDKIRKEDNISAPAPKSTKPVKHKHGEYSNVLLTDDELAKLKAEYGKGIIELVNSSSIYT